MISKNKKNN